MIFREHGICSFCIRVARVRLEGPQRERMTQNLFSPIHFKALKSFFRRLFQHYKCAFSRFFGHFFLILVASNCSCVAPIARTQEQALKSNAISDSFISITSNRASAVVNALDGLEGILSPQAAYSSGPQPRLSVVGQKIISRNITLFVIFTALSFLILACFSQWLFSKENIQLRNLAKGGDEANPCVASVKEGATSDDEVSKTRGSSILSMIRSSSKKTMEEERLTLQGTAYVPLNLVYKDDNKEKRKAWRKHHLKAMRGVKKYFSSTLKEREKPKHEILMYSLQKVFDPEIQTEVITLTKHIDNLPTKTINAIKERTPGSGSEVSQESGFASKYFDALILTIRTVLQKTNDDEFTVDHPKASALVMINYNADTEQDRKRWREHCATYMGNDQKYIFETSRDENSDLVVVFTPIKNEDSPPIKITITITDKTTTAGNSEADRSRNVYTDADPLPDVPDHKGPMGNSSAILVDSE